jgi:hypothetical protein
MAQEQRSLNGGRLVYGTNEALTGASIQWPMGERYGTIDGSLSGSSWNYRNMLASAGVDIAVKMDWKDAGGTSHSVKIAEAAANRFSDFKNVIVPVSKAFKRYYRHKAPALWMNGKNWQDVLSITDPVEPTLPSDGMIYAKCTTWTGIQIESYNYAFWDDAKNNFVITEWVFTNTDNVAKSDVYFALRGEPATSDHYPGNLWGNYIGAEYAGGKDPVRLYYNYDADVPADGNRDDRAEPNNLYGNFRKPQFMGIFLIHADVSTTDETSNKNAPLKGGWSQREFSPDLNISTHEKIYEFFSKPWESTGLWQPYFWPGSGDYIRVLDPATDPRTIEPQREQEKCGLFSFGPFQMAPGEDVRIVMGYAGGMLDVRSTIDLGWAYDWGATGLRSRKPLPTSYNAMLQKLGITLDSGRLLTKDQKDKILDTGIDSMIVNAKKAIDLWEKGNVRKGKGSFNTQLCPPSPAVTVTALPGAVKVEWDDAAEKYGSGITGYRVYRNYLRPPSLDTPCDTSFVLIADLKGTATRVIEDKNVTRGQNYYYYVTAVDNKGMEGSRFLNRGASGTLEQGVSPIRSPEADWKNKVVVVPNPYHSRGRLRYSGSDAGKLNFLNLPAYCNVHIYTMTGDLVQTLRHGSGSGDEGWLRQDTFNTMVIVSGIYIYVVEELDGPNGNATGETAIGKFVVVK